MTERTFVNGLEKVYQKEGFYTKKEVGVGYGVADLVLFRPNVSNCLRRIDHKQLRPLLNEGYFKVFDLLPDLESHSEPLALEELQDKTHYSPSFLKYKLLEDLKKAKYVKEIDRNYYFKVNGWLPIGKELIAIEAKLRDWKKGFYQANRYLTFADRVYLAVPKSISENVDSTLFKKHGVGLITLNAETGKKEVLIPARKKSNFNDTKRNYASEYFWGLKLRKSLTTA